MNINFGQVTETKPDIHEEDITETKPAIAQFDVIGTDVQTQ